MKIGIDGRALTEKRAGIGTYTYEIIKKINEIDLENEYYIYSNKKIFLDFKLNKNFYLVEDSAKIGTIWLYFKLPKILSENKIDAFWGTQHCLPKRCKYTKNIKYVLTIHDIALEIFKNIGSVYNTLIQKLFLRKSCKNADKIIAVSESTKNDLINILSINSDKITVIYEGIDQENEVRKLAIDEKEILEKYNINSSKFIFFLSTIEPRKNLDTAIKAFEIYKEKNKDSDLKFVISGGDGWKCQKTLENIKNSKFSKDIIKTGYITKEEKEYFFNECVAFLYPSLYEGFGIPVLEAFNKKAIVITSNVSSLPEVGGDAAFYLNDVYNAEELCLIIEKIEKMTSEEKEKIIELGKEQVKKFTWEKCANELRKEVIDINKIKVGIDLTYIREDVVSGIRKYSEEILNGLSKSNKKYNIVLFIDEDLEKVFLRDFPQYNLKKIKVRLKKIKYIRGIYNRTILKIAKKIMIKKEKCDIIIHPYTDEITPLLGIKKEISTIMDINPLEIAKENNPAMYKKLEKKYISLMNKNKYILTISEYSKKRLLDINPNYSGKIMVIPSAISKIKNPDLDIKDVIKSDDKYIFTINAFYKYKNQITLVKAFNKIKHLIPHNLILLGRPELNSNMCGYRDVIQYIKENELENRVKIYSNVSDVERNALLYNADMFVGNSLLEGFGRTPVEAAMCEIPVITTKCTSLYEVTMGLLYYYDNPTDENELAEKIIEVLNNKPSAKELKEIAVKFEKKYNEKNLADEYLKIIEEVLSNN